MGPKPLLQYVNATRWTASRRAPFMLEGRALLLLFSTIGLVAGLVIFDLRGLEFALWVFGVIILQVVVALWSSRQSRRFETRFWELVEQGDTEGLGALFRGAWLARLFSSRGWFLSREGLFYMLLGDFERAEAVLELAWLSTQPESRFSLVPLLCRTKYRLGHVDDVVVLAEDWLRADPEGPGVWYSMLCELRRQGSSADTEIALRFHQAPEVRDSTDREVREHVLSFR